MIYQKAIKVNDILFSRENKHRFEKTIFIIAILAFIIHFTLAYLVHIGLIPQRFFSSSTNITPNPLSTIYTPFSIILIYEIYLLMYYLPRSITQYLGKQYEIMALIFVRGIFDDFAHISVNNNPFDSLFEINLLYELGGLLILLLLIFCFYKLNEQKGSTIEVTPQELECRERYINKKKIISLILFCIFVFLFISSFFELNNIHTYGMNDILYLVKNMNITFFRTFFVALILTEVLLLLFTYNLAKEFNKVVRNSGFVISTILLKLSFKAEGLSNLIIILTAVAFGVAILGIYKLNEYKLNQTD